MRTAHAPGGRLIIGTLEKIEGVANITADSFDRDSDGKLTFDWEGSTDVDWDSSTTARTNAVKAGDRERLFVDEHGSVWRESQIWLDDEDPPSVPTPRPYDHRQDRVDKLERAVLAEAYALGLEAGASLMEEEARGRDEAAKKKGRSITSLSAATLHEAAINLRQTAAAVRSAKTAVEK